MANQVSAIDLKRLLYFNPDSITEDLTGAALNTLLSADGTTEVKNVHQDTWTFEEGEASQESYRNQLTGSVYRMGPTEMGDVTVKFTIGRYDYATKAALLGGTSTDTSWKRPRGIVDIKMGIIAVTDDDQYIVLPYANIKAREASTDGAIGLAVTGTMLEPKAEDVMPEYWFDISEVTSA